MRIYYFHFEKVPAQKMVINQTQTMHIGKSTGRKKGKVLVLGLKRFKPLVFQTNNRIYPDSEPNSRTRFPCKPLSSPFGIIFFVKYV